ncbi:ATP-dependent nuclease, partial [Candidatus Binatus sp.]|uniref:ATP-dependent nuclease n=1 Tax=Candidatus Binatus sp. TaxID=2811406 RepID=UPI003CB655E5
MRIKRLRIKNFRSIKEAELFPQEHNALLGPNNAGKTTLLESLALLLNPELPVAGHVIDENDFYLREYSLVAATASASVSETTEGPTVEGGDDAPPARAPEIRIEAVLSDLSEEDEDAFRRNLVVWQEDTKVVIDAVDRGADPFANGEFAIRIVFEGWYDEAEDDFFHKTFFLPVDTSDRDQCPTFTRDDKRRVGFLIYRDFRASNRPTTLEPNLIFGRLLQSQGVVPRHFDDVLSQVSGALAPMLSEADFASIINSYKAELERFLYLSFTNPSSINFELTDRTRSQIKATAQLYVSDLIGLPLQKMGAGTRSLATLATLTLIMRRRGRGILALEEPESFLFPHAQRRIIDECLGLA